MSTPGITLMSVYGFELTPDDNDTFLITVPLLPEATSFSETKEQAQNYARLAIEEAIAARIRGGLDVPAEPNAPDAGYIVVMPLMTSLKVDLYNTARAHGVNRAELARRLGWNRNSVDRLFLLDHNSRLEQLDAAFKALGARIDARVVEFV